MSKKIQVSTIRQEADVEVVFINSSIISKAIRASIAVKGILDKMREYNDAIIPVIKKDDEGGEVLDENGKPMPELDENGNPMFSYNYFKMDETFVEQFHKHVAPFIEELTTAFEE